MAINIDPIFPVQGCSLPVLINAANAAADGSGTVGTDLFLVVNADALKSGTFVAGIVFKSSQTTMAAWASKMCRVYLSDATGANIKIVGEIAMPGGTRSLTVPGAEVVYYFPQPISLQPGQKIYVSISTRATSADDTVAYALAGHYSL